MNNRIILALAIIIVFLGGMFYYTRETDTSDVLNTQTSTSTEIVNTRKATSTMSFFITSVNPGQGGNLGGLTGADNYCQSLAQSAGLGNKTWRAYLSAMATGTSPQVNAKDRIGTGPWYNFDGVLIASNITELHGTNNINKQTALTEKGDVVSGRGDETNLHDIMTGSTAQGTLVASSSDTTCNNWTSSEAGSAYLGHHDRIGINDSAPMKSWNSSHASRGCSLDALKTTGGGGLMYCFATN